MTRGGRPGSAAGNDPAAGTNSLLACRARISTVWLTP